MALLLGNRGRHGGDLQGDRRGVKVIKNTWRSKISLCRENRNLEYGQLLVVALRTIMSYLTNFT